MAKAELDAKDLANQIVINVTIKRYDEWRFRLWLAMQLIRFAAWIAWVNVEFTDETQTTPNPET